jgi:D-alanine transaminase
VPRVAYVDGRYLHRADAAVSPEDRGFLFADSVYEVFAVIGGVIADERGHIDRLERSLREIDIPMPMPRRGLSFILRETLRRNKLKNATLYLQVTRGSAPRNFPPPPGLRPCLVVMVQPMSFDFEARKKVAKKAFTTPDIRWARRDIKTTQLLAPVLARKAAVERGLQEALFVDEKGFITEASASNAWIVDKKGNLVTHPASGGKILKGITRSVMQALCKRDGLKIIERPFTVKEALAAKEIFTSSANGLFASIVELDGRKIGDGRPGPVVARLYDLYAAYLRDSKQVRWNP